MPRRFLLASMFLGSLTVSLLALTSGARPAFHSSAPQVMPPPSAPSVCAPVDPACTRGETVARHALPENPFLQYLTFSSATTASAAQSSRGRRLEQQRDYQQDEASSSSTASSGGRSRVFKRFYDKPPASPEEPGARPFDAVGVYLTGGSIARDDFRRETIEKTLELRGSALVFDVKGGHVFFSTTSPFAAEHDLIRPLQDLPAIIAEAKEKGLYTIARYIAVKDPVLAQTLPATQVRHSRTKRSIGDVWVDPEHPSVLEYNRQVIQDVVRSGIDEINLDYIRFGTEAPLEAFGLTGEEKADKLERFIRMARDAIDEVDPSVQLGLSTYAILGWNFPVNFEHVGQDIPRFSRMRVDPRCESPGASAAANALLQEERVSADPSTLDCRFVVDIISPMAYPSTFAEGAYYVPGKHPRSRPYYLVYRTLTGYLDLIGHENIERLRPWIQGYGLTAKQISDEIDAVYDAGACGFQVWNAQNDYTPTYGAMKMNTSRPERCAGGNVSVAGKQ